MLFDPAFLIFLFYRLVFVPVNYAVAISAEWYALLYFLVNRFVLVVSDKSVEVTFVGAIYVVEINYCRMGKSTMGTRKRCFVR